MLPLRFVLNLAAKLLASGIWVSERDRDAVWDTTVVSRIGEKLGAIVDVSVDDAARAVTVAHPGGAVGRAVHVGDQGCLILPEAATLDFEPTIVRPARDVVDPLPHAMHERMADAIDRAFVPNAHTAAVLVVHEGRVVAERYADGIGPGTQLESWSMGKSVMATLAGRLVHDGSLDPDAPAPVDEWSTDDRRRITTRDLLQMSSGLRFSLEDWQPCDEHPVPDHVRVYMDAIDVYAFAISAPAEHRPGVVGRYRNCDPLAVGAIARRLVEGSGDTWLTWPQRTLFDPIGIPRQVLETDRHGNFVITGFDFGTARGWARLGLLHLADGVWDEVRLLPEGWARFVSTPAPGWDAPEYGGLFWLNRPGTWPLPEDAYWMSGDGGQRCFVVPSLDLVVVRLGHTAGSAGFDGPLADALRAVVAAS